MLSVSYKNKKTEYKVHYHNHHEILLITEENLQQDLSIDLQTELQLQKLCCLPAQGFNVVSSVGRMAEVVTEVNVLVAVDCLIN